MSKKSSTYVHWVSGLLALAVAPQVWGYQFVPTDSEFAAWPTYCQSRYVETTVGLRSKWAATYPASARAVSKSQLGAAAYERVHHYCAATIWLKRSKVERDPTMRRHYLNLAEEETKFTLSGLPLSNRIYAIAAGTLAEVYDEMGEPERAVQYLEDTIAQHPSDPRLYAALALLHRKRGELELARDALLRADEVTSGKSADVQYNLGLVYLELGDKEAALARAKQAYGMGYPLAGLREKLQRQGAWAD